MANTYSIGSDITDGGKTVNLSIPVGTLKSLAISYRAHYGNSIDANPRAKKVEQELWEAIGENELPVNPKLKDVFLTMGPISEKDGWAHGKATIGGMVFTIEAKVYDEPSDYGIRGSRVSKLSVRRASDNHEFICYDRGWDSQAKPSKAGDMAPAMRAIVNKVVKQYRYAEGGRA